MNKSYDPHSVYGYDPESGAPRERPDYGSVRRRPGFSDDRRTCAGCGERIEWGEETHGTVTWGTSIIEVYAHAGHWDMARANALLAHMQDES